MKRAITFVAVVLMLGVSGGHVAAQETPAPTAVTDDDAYDGPKGDIGTHWVVEGLTGDLGHPVVAGDLLLLRQGQTLVAYDQSSGEKVWTFKLAAGLSDPAADDERVYLTTRDAIVALDLESGETQWEVSLWFGRESYGIDTASTPLVAPAVADGTLYAVAGPLAFAIDAESGAYRWRQTVPVVAAIAPPAVAATAVVYSARYDENRSTAVALSRDDGTILWPSFGSNAGYPPALRGSVGSDDVVVSLDDDGDLVVQTAANGGYLWYRECAVPNDTVPHIALIGASVVTSCSGRIQLFDAFSGERQRDSETSGATVIGTFGPVLTLWDDAGANDRVRAIDPLTGTEAWSHDFLTAVQGNRLTDGVAGSGRVFVTGTNADGTFLLAIGGTEGPHGASLPVLLNPPAPGSFASIATESDLRGAPSAEGAVWATLPPNTQVLVTGSIEVVDDITWWEVVLPETGDIGWVEPAAFDTAGDD